MNDPRPALRAMEDRYAARERLFLLHLDLTWRCPLACPHCYLPSRASDELDTGAWLDLMDQARRLEVAQVVLSGGEPMLRSDFATLLHAARDRGFAVLVKTTGLDLEDRDADRFARLGWVFVDLSLHSLDPAAHDAFVGLPGAWHRTVRAIDALSARGVHVRIARNLVAGKIGRAHV